MKYSEFIKKTLGEIFGSYLSENMEDLEEQIGNSLDEYDDALEDIFLKIKNEHEKLFESIENEGMELNSIDNAFKNENFRKFIMIFMAEIFSNEKYLLLGKKIMEIYFRNNDLHEIFKKSPNIYGFLFESITKELTELRVKKPNEIAMIIQQYLETQENYIDEAIIIESLLIFQEMKEKIIKWEYLISSEVFFQESNDTFKNLIDNKDIDEFQIYFFDWVLKFGYLLESHFKNIIKFQLRIKLLKQNEKDGYIKNEKLTLGYLIKKLGAQEDITPDIRNAIFHANFSLNYNIDLEEKTITFKKGKKVLQTMNILDFINAFNALVKYIRTYTIALDYIYDKEQFREDFFSDIKDNLDFLKKPYQEVKKLFSS